MKEFLNVALMILIVIGAMILACVIAGKKMKNACQFIVKDLQAQKAVDPASAVPLPYCKRQMFKFGFRDYRPQGLEQLLKYDVVRMTEQQTFYLGPREMPGIHAGPAAGAGGTDPVRPA